MTTSAYRLSQRSSRRRRMLLLGPSYSSSVEARPRVVSSTTTASHTSRPRQQPAPTQASDTPSGSQCRLDPARALTWVFAGDELIAGASTNAGFAPLVESYVEGLQGSRQNDRFVEVLAPGLSIQHLVSTWDTRISVHRPDVLVVLCGHNDAVPGMRGLRNFEDALVNLLISCRGAGILPIINTPPCHPEHARDRVADRQIYLEALRAEARSHNAVLVDHWGHWEWVASEMGHNQDWYDESGLFPGPAGYRQMQRMFLQSMGLLHNTQSATL